jgi:hypothetical protein
MGRDSSALVRPSKLSRYLRSMGSSRGAVSRIRDPVLF